MNNTANKTYKVWAIIIAIGLFLTLGIGTAAAKPLPDIDNPNETSHLLDGRQYPEFAPQINYFFAQAPTAQEKAQGIRYWLNYQIDHVTRAEIFGHVMQNPNLGRFPIYGDKNGPNHWVIWARNDEAWIEAHINVNPNTHTSANRLSPVTVGTTETTVAVRHPDFVDGDTINLYVNGLLVLSNHQLSGFDTVLPVYLQRGMNHISVQIVSEGQVPGAVTQLSIENVVDGDSIQVTQLLRNGQSEVMQLEVR